MKLIATFLLNFSSLLTFSQTKQETIDWLNDKFSGSQTSIYGSDYYSFSRHLKIDSKGSFTITQFDFYRYENGTSKKFVSEFKGDFKYLSSTTFSSKKNEEKGKSSFSSTSNTFLYFSCTIGKTIKQIDYKEGTMPSEKQITNTTNYAKEVLIAVIPESSDQSLIERSKKAFIHLIKLCGGKKEAF